MTSFLQSDMWAEFQKSVGREVFKIGQTNIFKHDLPFGKSYLYIPAVPLLTNYEFQMIQDLAKREKAIFVKAEPMEDVVAQGLVRAGYKKSSKNIQPHRTVILDLTTSVKELLGTMHQKTRYNIRVAERSGIEFKETQDIGAFWQLMEKTTERDKFSSHSFEYYQKLLGLCKLYIVYKDATPLAAALVLIYKKRGHYLHGASDHTHRAFRAPYALHRDIIKSLIQQNVTSYDFWGVDADKWPGVTRFKLGWGGRQIEYPGAFDLVIAKMWYMVYRVRQAIP